MIGYAVLIATLPVAIMGLLAPSNEYRAIGVDAVDCDGPISVMLFAVPALVVYGLASAMFLYRFRQVRMLVPGVLCSLICIGLIWNIGNAVGEQWKSRGEAACESGQ